MISIVPDILPGASPVIIVLLIFSIYSSRIFLQTLLSSQVTRNLIKIQSLIQIWGRAENSELQKAPR